jgi:hypothetical protein
MDAKLERDQHDGLRNRWEDNIKLDFREIGWGYTSILD